MAELLSPIKLIRARCSQSPPHCYLFHVVFRGTRARLLCVVRACGQRAPTRPLAPRQRPITVSRWGQIYMSHRGPPRTPGPLETQLSSLPPCDHTHFLLDGVNKHRPSPCPSAPQSRSICHELRARERESERGKKKWQRFIMHSLEAGAAEMVRKIAPHPPKQRGFSFFRFPF